MPDSFPQTVGPQIGGAFIQVASQFLGQSIVESVRRQFPTRKTQRGDAYMDGARHLLQANINLMNAREKQLIEHAYEDAKDTKTELNNSNLSKIQIFLKAREYKQQSKEFFVIVKIASDRGIDDSLLDQIRGATGRPGRFEASGSQTPNTSDDPPPSPLTGLTNSSVNLLEGIELTTYRSERTQDVAATMTLHGQDETTQDIMATFSPEVFDCDITDQGDPSITVVPARQSNVIRGTMEDDEEN